MPKTFLEESELVQQVDDEVPKVLYIPCPIGRKAHKLKNRPRKTTE